MISWAAAAFLFKMSLCQGLNVGQTKRRMGSFRWLGHFSLVRRLEHSRPVIVSHPPSGLNSQLPKNPTTDLPDAAAPTIFAIFRLPWPMLPERHARFAYDGTDPFRQPFPAKQVLPLNALHRFLLATVVILLAAPQLQATETENLGLAILPAPGKVEHRRPGG